MREVAAQEREDACGDRTGANESNPPTQALMLSPETQERAGPGGVDEVEVAHVDGHARDSGVVGEDPCSEEIGAEEVELAL